MLSPEIKELCLKAVELHEKTKWDNEESRRWDVIDDTDTWVDIARAALALNEDRIDFS